MTDQATTDAGAPGAFDNLLNEIGVMAKAQAKPGDADTAGADAAIAAAAAEGEGDGRKKVEGEEGDTPPFAKSFKMKLEDGTEVDAMDGTELVKSLIHRVETNEETLTKALGGVVEIVKAQDALIKSLVAKVDAFGNSAPARKTVLAIQERPAGADVLAKSVEPAGVSGEEFLTKAMDACTAGRITSREVSISESHINSGLAPPADIVRKVLAP